MGFSFVVDKNGLGMTVSTQACMLHCLLCFDIPHLQFCFGFEILDVLPN